MTAAGTSDSEHVRAPPLFLSVVVTRRSVEVVYGNPAGSSPLQTGHPPRHDVFDDRVERIDGGRDVGAATAKRQQATMGCKEDVEVGRVRVRKQMSVSVSEEEVVVVTKRHQKRQPTELRESGRRVSSAPAEAVCRERTRIQQLCKSFPEATESEVLRFATRRSPDKASRKLRSYLQWRGANRILDRRPDSQLPMTDEDIWNSCAEAAASIQSVKLGTKRLPRLIRVVGADGGGNGKSTALRDRGGRRILHFLPAMLDPDLASMSLYSLCTVLYFDRILDRDSLEEVTMVVDVRPGEGWANPAPLTLVPYVRSISKIGADMFPERLWRCIVVPVPWFAEGVWQVIRGFLDPEHVEKAHLVAGPASVTSPMPPNKMTEFVGADVVRSMEQSRSSEFC